jgi:Transposase DDE domain
MFVRAKIHPTAKRARWSILVCHNKRVRNKIVQHTIKRIGVTSCAIELQLMLQIGKDWIADQDLANNFEMDKIGPSEKIGHNKMNGVQLKNIQEVSRVNVGYEDIFGKLFNVIGFAKIFDKNVTDVLKATVFGRIYSSGSKRRVSYELDKRFEYDVSEDKIYRMMDVLHPKIDDVKSTVFNYVKSEYGGTIALMFFDVTTLVLESTEVDELRNFGFSKDCKFNNTQLVLALATTSDGMPVGYKLFPGNTAEVTTLISCVNEWRKTVEIGPVTVVADSAMMSKGNLEQLKAANMQYIIAYSLLKAPATVQEQALNEADYIREMYGEDLYWFKKIKLDDERCVIVTYNKRRHQKDAKDRDRAIQRIKKRLGTDNSGVGAAKKLISNRGYIKYIKVDGKDVASLNEDKVASAAQWDGMHAIITSCKDRTPMEVLSRYRNLWVIEESFRINKTDLKVRPVYHRKQSRIESHLAICFIVYTIMRVAQAKLKRAGVNMSVACIKEAITDVQASLLCDSQTGVMYKMLSAIPEEAEIIYDVFNVKRGLSQITELSNA